MTADLGNGQGSLGPNAQQRHPRHVSDSFLYLDCDKHRDAWTHRIIPVSKTVGIFVRVAANHGDKGIAHETNHEKDLEDGHVEFRSSKPSDS